ncbi:MAG: peptidylprolyl isomerase [Candidatus Marithrix sp.]|nr:peptidylprolyl isomerase [Candidatus Marithrix sp.]
MFIRTGFLLCALLTALSSFAEGDAIVIVNGETITQQEYDDYAKVRQNGTETDSKTLIDELVQRKLLKQDAIKEKLEQHPDFIEKLEETKSQLLMTMAIHNFLDKNQLTDAQLKQKYDEQLANSVTPSEYQVRHIQLKTEAEAQAVVEELKNGKDFTVIAKDKSTDIGSANQGGDLGWINESVTEPEFWKAVNGLEKDKYTIAKSKFGWHVIQLIDVRLVKIPEFANVKGKIREVMQSQQLQEYINNLLKSAKVEKVKK